MRSQPMHFQVFLVVSIILDPVVGQLDAGPWPSFGGNAAQTGLSEFDTGGALIKTWSYATSGIVTNPVLDSCGRIYFGGEKLYALHATTGSLQWSSTTGGIMSSPALDAFGRVFAGSLDSSLYSFNAATGSLLWSYTTGGRINASPALDAFGRIFIGSRDKILYALNTTSGSLLWSYGTGDTIYASPALDASGRIFVSSVDKILYALNTTSGSPLWSYTTEGAIYASPVLDAFGRVFVGSFVRLYALNQRNGSLLWSYSYPSLSLGYVPGSPALDAFGRIFTGSGSSSVYALNSTSGSLLWSYSTGGYICASLALDALGRIFVGNEDNTLYALNTTSGSLLWSYTTMGDTTGTANLISAFSAPALASGRVFVGSYQRLYSYSSSSCLPGFHVSGSGKDCIPCNTTFISSYANNSRGMCVPCPANFYCNATGMSSPLPCPPGSLCPQGTNTPSGFLTASPVLTPCPAGAYCPADTTQSVTNAGVVECPSDSYCFQGTKLPVKCPIGTFGGYGGLSTPFCAGQCPIGYYGVKEGATSLAAGCKACPNGTTTLSMGSSSVASCFASVYRCPTFFQPGASSAAADCVPLVCSPPLTFSSDGLGCVGVCGAGELSSASSTLCVPCSSGLICPGFNISFPMRSNATISTASLAPQLLSVYSSPDSSLPLNPTCRMLASIQSHQSTSTAASDSSAAEGGAVSLLSPAIVTIIIVASLLGGFAIAAYAASLFTSKAGRVMTSFDLFSLKSPTQEGEGPRRLSTSFGGLCTLVGIFAICALACVLIARFQEDNILSVSSLSILATASSTASYLSTPLSTTTLQGVGPLSGLYIGIQSLTSLGSCGSAIPGSLSSSSIMEGRSWSVSASIPNCGDGTSLLLLSCPSCEFSALSTLSVRLPYACQALGFTAFSVNADGSISSAALPLSATSSSGAALITNMSWTIAPVVSMQFDQAGTSSVVKRGYQLLSLANEASYAEPSAAITPLSSSLLVSFSTPLQSFYSSTTLSQKTSPVQLLSSIIGLAGLLGLFRILHDTSLSMHLLATTKGICCFAKKKPTDSKGADPPPHDDRFNEPTAETANPIRDKFSMRRFTYVLPSESGKSDRERIVELEQAVRLLLSKK